MESTLNLARKWRSKNFDQIVGQELSIKMLKNSLYLGSYFPVYLFSGQRGCGKTSTARVFAAALNCEQLQNFQKKPKDFIVPCLTCRSCMAMAAGKHPDFFEIDAASHTGVDTIRNIIDASNLMPLMGSKKIYLIDEAHMLSKASFNALLKILEEPPMSVLFILATTDQQKIIETVRSRCFQLFFKPIQASALMNHLSEICQKETIAFDADGLQLIIDETEGSARDAINVLEQVRFARGAVTKDAVLQVLGHISDDQLLQIVQLVVHGKPKKLLEYLQGISLESYSAEFVWYRLIELLRAALWLKHGVVPKAFQGQASRINQLFAQCSLGTINALLDVLCSNESYFDKTTAKHSLLEMILLQMCQKRSRTDEGAGMPTVPAMAAPDELESEDEDDEFEDEEDDDEEEEIDEEDAQSVYRQKFVSSVAQLKDPLLHSLFSQAKEIIAHDDSSRLDVVFSKDLQFFFDQIEAARSLWQPLLDASFGKAIQFSPLFTAEATKKIIQKPVASESPTVQTAHPSEQPRKAPVPAQNSYKNNNSYTRSTPRAAAPSGPREMRIDTADAAAWPTASLMMRYFPGTLTEIQGLHMNKFPSVVLVGRTNVGKSTLFNRLSNNAKSIAFDQAGVTRDAVMGNVTWQGRSFNLIDSGGLSFRKTQDEILEAVRQRVLQLIQDSNVIVFMVDGATGILPEDRELSSFLHKQGKQVILSINKAEGKEAQEHLEDFEKLGFGKGIVMSAMHGTGISDVLEQIVAHVPVGEVEEPTHRTCKIALIGKPNVGKSSLLNLLIKKDRAIVADVPGTTREPISEHIQFYKEDIQVTDTPGIRRKRAVNEPLEEIMVRRAIKAIEDADIVLLLSDASEGTILDQELKLAFYAFEHNKGLIMLYNKADLTDELDKKDLDRSLEVYEYFMKKIPQLTISCKTDKNIGKILPLVNKVWHRYMQQFTDEELTDTLKEALVKKPLYHKSMLLFLRKVRQIKTGPITLVLIVNKPEWFGASQLGYLDNALRRKYDLLGVPIKFIVRAQG